MPFHAAELPGVAYPTLYTGLRPSDLGVYFPVQWSAEAQCLRPWSTCHGAESIFSRIDRAGRRIVVLDPPECDPEPLRSSLCVSGVQFRARVLLHPWSSDDQQTHRLLGGGPSPRADEVFGPAEPDTLLQLRDALLTSPARLRNAALRILREDPPDCLWLNWCAMHIAAHQFFRLEGLGNHPERRNLEATRVQLARAYDQTLGDVLAALPPGTSILLFFPKGMRETYGWPDLLPGMLRRILKEPDPVESPMSALRSLVPARLRRFVADQLPESSALSLMARAWSPRADWSRTRAIPLASDCPGFIRLNLSGRERLGSVPDSAAAGLLDEIRDGLRTFHDTDGEPCADEILTPRELFGEGSRVGEFPDLIVRWNSKPRRNRTRVHSDRFGTLDGHFQTGRSGSHGPGAFAILLPGSGETVPPFQTVECEDVPTTILSALQIPHTGGRPLFRSGPA